MRAERLLCSKCGKPAACSCGVDYVPKLTYVAMHMTVDDDRSDRAIAKELKVSHETVRTARKGLKELQLSRNLTVKKQAKRKGRDGKLRRLPRAATRSKPTNGRSPYSVTARDRLRGGARKAYEKAWIEHDFAQRATPNELWEHSLTAALRTIIKLESDREQHDIGRQFTMTPCTYKTAVQVIEMLSNLVNQLGHNQKEQEHGRSRVHH